MKAGDGAVFFDAQINITAFSVGQTNRCRDQIAIRQALLNSIIRDSFSGVRWSILSNSLHSTQAFFHLIDLTLELMLKISFLL
jgi:hypothetical protein